jgi:hypothetical protein
MLGLSSSGRRPLAAVPRFHRLTRVRLPSYCPQSVLGKFLSIRKLDQRGDEVRIYQRYGNKGVLWCSLAF